MSNLKQLKSPTETLISVTEGLSSNSRELLNESSRLLGGSTKYALLVSNLVKDPKTLSQLELEFEKVLALLQTVVEASRQASLLSMTLTNLVGLPFSPQRNRVKGVESSTETRRISPKTKELIDRIDEISVLLAEGLEQLEIEKAQVIKTVGDVREAELPSDQREGLIMDAISVEQGLLSLGLLVQSAQQRLSDLRSEIPLNNLSDLPSDNNLDSKKGYVID